MANDTIATMNVEKMNVQNLMTVVGEAESDSTVHQPVSKRAMKALIAALIITAVVLTGFFSFKTVAETKKTTQLYSETATIFSEWAEPFAGLGETSIFLGTDRIVDGAENSIALSELRDKLENLEIEEGEDKRDLSGLKINIRKDKSFTLSEVGTEEVVFDAKKDKIETKGTQKG